VVQNAAVVVFTKGEDVHQTDTSAGVFDHTTVDLRQFVVEDKSDLTSGLGETEDVSDHERDWHA
jgi:hypothetical protein